MRTQKSLAQSAKALIEAKIQALGVGPHFRVLFDRIETPGGGTIVFVGMANHTAESIKSLENCRIAWVEEAQNSLSEKPRSVTPDHSRRELGDLVLVESTPQVGCC